MKVYFASRRAFGTFSPLPLPKRFATSNVNPNACLIVVSKGKRNPPNCTISDSRVFEKFVSGDE